MSTVADTDTDIAIIAAAGRFPKAGNLDEFWQNLRNGVEAISFFTDEELEAAGAAVPKNDPNFVKACGMMEGVELFDAAFFGMTPKEAEVTDPQHRIFLECAWEAMEEAGYDSERINGRVGVFAGLNTNTYMSANLATRPDVMELAGPYQLMLANGKEFLPTRVSYKLNLTGPSLNIQTACSTSLVAVCLACQQLLDYQCDVALAGAVSIVLPQKRGYLYQEGGICSPDGHTRAFDAKAAGTVLSEGVGIVVLKRLTDALADGDQVLVVIKGFAVNNDGAHKVGYTAPSVDGQAEVIAMAHAMAAVDPSSISYVETHGTATPLGDPIEVAGLTKAFRARTADNGFCAIGSVKTNIGHSDVVAGVAGLIKTALALQHRELPPSLHFSSPNPKIDFANSPFYVNAQLAEWKAGLTPRRAGVSSFGIGGTNAHVVVEESPRLEPSSSSRPSQLLLLSAKSLVALDHATANLAAHFKEHPDVSLADAAYTLQVGRRAFLHRRMLVCHDTGDAVAALESRDPKRLGSRTRKQDEPSVVFMFPGQGAQQVNMAQELYRSEPVFRQTMDRCAEILRPHLGLDLLSILYPIGGKTDEAQLQLTQTMFTQPALFAVEYALATLWMSWGVRPAAMIGHSLGEYVAACLAGVFSLEDALVLVAARGRMMQQLPAGSMLAVRLPEKELMPMLDDQLSLAAVNGTALCVVSGPTEAVASLQQRLEQSKNACRPLHTSHAFHSAMMDPIIEPFTERVGGVRLGAPQIPYLSNVTGTWITAAETTDPVYWAQHLRQAVRFEAGLAELLKEPQRVLLEVGPGQTLTALTRQHPASSMDRVTIGSLAGPKEQSGDTESMLGALGRLWLAGVTVDWMGFYAQERRRRVRLPTYPFERQRYWVEPGRVQREIAPVSKVVAAKTVEEPRGETVPGAESMPEPSESACHQESIGTALRNLFHDLSGKEFNGVDGTLTFVEMGFESLFFAQACHAIETRFGVRVAFRQLVEELSTIDALAAHIEKRADAVRPRTPQVMPVIAQSTVPALVPLTEAQKEIWFAAQLSNEASCAFNQCYFLHLRGPLNLEALRQAVQQLVDRHNALRTTFSAAGDCQHVVPALTVEVPLVDLSGMGNGESERNLDSLLASDAVTSFDLVQGPLVRVRVVRLSDKHHVLLFTVHHIICDGRSLAILLHELGELYSAVGRGQKGLLPPPVQYDEFARLQVAQQQNADHAAAESYWLKQFAGEPPVLELPADHPRPALKTFRACHRKTMIDPALWRALKRVSAHHGCTLFSTLLAAYYAWLHRLTGQQEIVVGVPVADFATEESDTLVGHTVNFLPVRAELANDPTFAVHLAAVKQLFWEAYEHRQCTLGGLIRKLNRARDFSRLPLVGAVFNLGKALHAVKFQDLDMECAHNPHSLSPFDFGMGVSESGDLVELECFFNADLFEPTTIDRWLGHFQTLLKAVAADVEQRLSQLPLMAEAERGKVLVTWNDTQRSYPRDVCLHQLFEAQVVRTPEATALVWGGERFSYAELNRRSNQLAHTLRSLGVGPETLVALCVDRSPELLIGVLGVLKAGGAYVPLDPAYPLERLRFVLEDTRVPVLLTQERLCDSLPVQSTRVVCIDRDRELIAKAETSNPGSGVQPGNLAYVIYTSGSTGKPKGVAIEHHSPVTLVHWAQEVFTPDECAGVLFSTSICFDLSIFEMFVPLSRGGKIILAENALQLPALTAAGEVTLINTVPSAMTELIRGLSVPPSVHTVNLAGEPLTVELVGKIYELPQVHKVYDLYGPSETTTYSTWALRRADGPATIGRPIANTRIYLLDAHEEPVPVGVPGQIYIGGDGVVRGYLNRPELTAERFVPDRFSSQPAARLYKTGDLARYLPDGNLEFLGRMDHQVKIRGFRIELGEIETLLRQHPAVQESVVVAREDTPGEKRLVAYVVVKPGQPGPNGELRLWLVDKLPHYMVPAAFVTLESMPLTANGKINRRGLPAPDFASLSEASQDETPRKPAEQVVAKIWCEVLNLQQVGIHDNFFALGGHSLLAARMASRLNEAFGVELPLRRLFEHPSVASLAEDIEKLLIEEISHEAA